MELAVDYKFRSDNKSEALQKRPLHPEKIIVVTVNAKLSM